MPGPDQALYQLFHPQGRLGRRLPADSAALSRWIERMAGGDDWVADSLLEHLPLWGWRLLFHMSNSGLIFRRYPSEEFDRRYGTWNSRSRNTNKAGIYHAGRNEIVVNARFWHGRILHHEMGHALDRMVSTLNSSFSTGLWHGFASTRSGFLTDYAATHPQEYLAVCLERFLWDDGDALWLERNDPGMHALLTALFELSSANY
jgi:hypothetical protein